MIHAFVLPPKQDKRMSKERETKQEQNGTLVAKGEGKWYASPKGGRKDARFTGMDGLYRRPAAAKQSETSNSASAF